MARKIASFFGVLLLVVPVLASAGPLDDYYLSRLVPKKADSHQLSMAMLLPSQPDRCLTGVRHQAKMDWNKLETGTQKVLASVLARPTLTDERTYAPLGGHFTIHYSTLLNGTNTPDLTDNNGNGVPDWVETVAATFEHVYQVEIGSMGYKRPPVTSYDVYLEDLSSQSVYGYTTDTGTGVTSVSFPSYIEIDKSFTNSIYVNAVGGPFSPQTSLEITAAHEFHHAIQYGYNYYFESYYAEMTSTWMEDEVYDSANQLYSYLPHYLPSTATIAANAPGDNSSEYGRWIYNRYLAEKYGSSIVKSIWEDLATKPAPANTSTDIPMFPVINEVLAANGSSIGAEVFGFAKKLLFSQNWTTHVNEVSRIYSSSLDIVGPLPVTATKVVAPKPTLAPYTFVYYQYTPPTSGTVVFDFTGKAAALAVTAFVQDQNGSYTEIPYDAAAAAISVPVASSTATIYLVYCNNTAATTTTAAAASGGSHGGCFIATAAYGSYLHPKVMVLRAFRDNYLLTNAPGRFLVACYYRLSPPIADVIAQHEWMRAVVRVMLLPVIFAVEHPGGALLVLILSVMGLIWWLPRRGRVLQMLALRQG